jgi:hypothetical protein
MNAEINIERAVVSIAGAFVFISVLLAVFHSLYWLWFTAFVGANLMQAGYTGFCPLAKILRFFGLKSGIVFK